MNKTLARVCALTLLASAAVAAVWANGAGASASTGGPERAGADTTVTDDPRNPMLSEWTGPYGGAPPFDRVRVADFKPALEAAMNENLSEVERIANDPAPPTFENTIVALEKAGHALDRVTTFY
jgi:peptidyl-dipeptidase Dcp